MARENHIELQSEAIENLLNVNFKVKPGRGHIVHGHNSGRMRIL